MHGEGTVWRPSDRKLQGGITGVMESLAKRPDRTLADITWQVVEVRSLVLSRDDQNEGRDPGAD